MKKFLTILIVILVLIGILYVGYNYMQKKEEATEEKEIMEEEEIVEEEVEEMEGTKGTYYSTAFGGETFFFEPIEGQIPVITNSEEAFELLGIDKKYLTECPDFYGEAELVLSTTEELEEPYGTAPRVKVLEVVSMTDPVCEIYK